MVFFFCFVRNSIDHIEVNAKTIYSSFDNKKVNSEENSNVKMNLNVIENF